MAEVDVKKHWLDYLAAWVAVFAAVGSRFGATASWYQFRASKDQLQSMRFDQRPWISLEMSPEGPLVRDESDGFAYTFGYSLSNVGRSPASKVMFTATLLPLADPQESPPVKGGFSYPDPSTALRRARVETCKANEEARVAGMGSVIFPNSTQNLRWKAHSPKLKRGFVPGFAVVACVEYQISGDTEIHRTVRVFELTAREYGKMIDLGTSDSGPTKLVFFPHPVEGFFAD